MHRLTFILFLTASGVGSAESTPAEREFFENKVRPILVERCYQCHSHRDKKQRGGLHVDSRASLLEGGDTGPAVVVGQPDKSLLIQAVRYEHDHVRMPPKEKMLAPEIRVLEEWVRQGLVFPDGGGKPEGAIDIAEGRKFWSFQPLRTHSLPAVADGSWPLRRMDFFLLEAMEKHGVRPAAEASRRVLIRRATFDLIGLPPTPEETEAFERDTSPDAYARLIDRLLASPHYGERWGRIWLDLARYADGVESWANIKGQPWLYRDWVVRAFNEDLPYDVFVRKQLAADLMPDAPVEDRAALGFLGLSPVYWKEPKLAPDMIKTIVAEEWGERIETVTRTYLGLTVGCARCHDHKFDPITTADYYALAGVFASTRQIDRALLPPEQAKAVESARQRVRPWQEEIARLQKQKQTPAIEQQIGDLRAKIDEVRRSTPFFDAPLAAVVDDAGQHVVPDGPHRTKIEYKPGVPQDVAIQKRGNPSKLGPVVPRRFLEVLSPDGTVAFTQGSGRLELADAIVTEAAPLAARVIVNRVWKAHFGTGLVETPSDFGFQGERPSHPELLDDLAGRFIASGWSLKWLQREIVLSAGYRQSSTIPESKHRMLESIDPGNRLVTYMNRRRLEIEAWRDAMLAVTGKLNLQPGGPPMNLGDANNQRRTIYGIVKRRELDDLLRLHDFPDPIEHSAARLATTTPLQQLFVLNSPFLEQQAAALVKRLKTEEPHDARARIQRAYALLYGRPATERQVILAREFLTPETDATWLQYCRVLLGSNEFLFID